MFDDFKYIDFGDFDAIGFDAEYENGEYNLQIVFFALGQDEDENGDKVVESGMIIRTSIFTENVAQMAEKIRSIYELELFGHLRHLNEGHIIMDVDGELEITQDIDWDTAVCEATVNSPTLPSVKIH